MCLCFRSEGNRGWQEKGKLCDSDSSHTNSKSEHTVEQIHSYSTASGVFCHIPVSCLDVVLGTVILVPHQQNKTQEFSLYFLKMYCYFLIVFTVYMIFLYYACSILRILSLHCGYRWSGILAPMLDSRNGRTFACNVIGSVSRDFWIDLIFS